jgi:long-chain fatty acid transport protein
MKRFTRAACFALLAAPATAGANGFLLNDHGASTTGRANAVTATIDNGAAIVYNPAGLAARDGFNVYAGASLVVPDSSFTDSRTGATTDNEAGLAVTPTAFVHQRFDFLAVGLGFHSPFGSTVQWPSSSPGRDELRKQSLHTYFITAAAAVNLDRWAKGLKFGIGVDLVPATVELHRDVLFGNQVGTAHLGGNALGVGARAGLQYQAGRKLSFGVAYRSPVKLDFEGDGDFDIGPPYRSELPPDGQISTSVTLPQSVLAGVAYRPSRRIELEVDLQWTGWSSFDELDIRMPDGSSMISDRGYEDTFTVRAGAEVLVSGCLALRGGYAYDPTPIPREKLTVNLPDINRHVVSAGGTYRMSRRTWVDLGLLWVLPGERSTSDTLYQPALKGIYEVQAVVAALSYGASFGGKGRK